MGEFFKLDNFFNQTDQCYPRGATIESANGAFFACLLDGGALYIYRGSAPRTARDRSDKQLWHFGSYKEGESAAMRVTKDGRLELVNNTYVFDERKQGTYFVALEDDGRLSLYQGKSPSDADSSPLQVEGKALQVKSFSIQRMTFANTATPVRVESTPRTCTLRNDSESEQGVVLDDRAEVTLLTSWERSSTSTFSLKLSAEFSVDGFFSTSLEISTEESKTVTESKGRTETSSRSWSATITVPPRATIEVRAQPVVTEWHVDYEAVGDFTYEDGTTAPGRVQGTYCRQRADGVEITMNQLREAGRG